MKRRTFLGASAATLLTACRSERTPTLGLLGAEDMEKGHRVWTRPTTWSATPTRTPITIVGGGVAGLSAAWRLRRGGYSGPITLLELSSALGGTAAAGGTGDAACPLGAHYITVPNEENLHTRRMLEDFGVIDATVFGRPRFREDMLCAAPEERLFADGRWTEGLWPESASAEDRRQRDAFAAVVATWTARVGSDGLPAFSIPVARSSRDPEILALAAIPFSDWLDAQGFTAPVLRWWIEYGTRDDYGTRLPETSAWAGLHYHCARRPFAADNPGTDILTWPAGNGWLVEKLAAAAQLSPRVDCVARRVTPGPDGVTVDFEASGEQRTLLTEHLVLAVPSIVASRLLDAPLPVSRATPWEVVNLTVARLPTPRLGLREAWDSVIYGSDSLGYVHAGHQRRTFGPTILTWYRPLVGDPTVTRRTLAAESGRESYERAHAELIAVHPDLEVTAATVQRWGHGTIRPEPGLVPPTHAVEPTDPRIQLAHTDRSGMSLFEEASWHGVRAAEAILHDRGLLNDAVLTRI